MQPVEVYVDDESKLTLHGLVQHYTMLTEEQKNKRLMDLLDQLDFNQVCLLGKSLSLEWFCFVCVLILLTAWGRSFHTLFHLKIGCLTSLEQAIE